MHVKERYSKALELLELYDNAPCGFQVVGADGVFLHMNRAQAKWLGKTRDELIGKMSFADFLDDESRGAWRRAQAQMSSRGRVENVELLIVGASGIAVRVCMSAVAVRDARGGLLLSQQVLHDIGARKEAEDRIGYLANHDRLTALPNRALLYDRLSVALSRARRLSEPLALFVLDLDDFKPVNDLHGHEGGDRLLRITAQRLLSCVRDMDTVARLGGDEFCIMLAGMGQRPDIVMLAQRIIAKVSAPIRIGESVEVAVGVSIGIAQFPACGSEIDTLIAAADRAMYASKQRGKNTFTICEGDGVGAGRGIDWIVLGDGMLLGWPPIDAEHQAIVDRLNELNLAVASAADDEGIAKRFADMADIVMRHFAHEEQLMDECAFPERAAHHDDHRRLEQDLARFQVELARGREASVLLTLKDWFVGHLLAFDKPLADFVHGRPVAGP